VHAAALNSFLRLRRYLDSDDLLHAARVHGCTAVHPGYGMLSESCAFAAAVEAAALIWIGPSPSVLSLFGNKVTASARARSLGLPIPACSCIHCF
jgi:acetyl/propionyl-CoA carboxylase alpha subunit